MMSSELNLIGSMNKVLICNNGLSAVKFITSVQYYFESRGQDCPVKFFALATMNDIQSNSAYIHLAHLLIPVPDGASCLNFGNIELIVKCAIEYEVDCVWPGWGHASENPALARALEIAGVGWVGPPSRSMQALGDKIESLLLAQKIGLPCALWSGSGKSSVSEALILNAKYCEKVCDEIGYPLMLKTAEGGGGKGIRVVRNRGEVEKKYKEVVAEMRSVGSSASVFAMQCIEGCRHIEIQVLSDKAGLTIALDGRDCSVQRRNQKIIEEGPLSEEIGIPRELSEELQAHAVRLSSEVGYEGAGTVEFLYDAKEKKAYFLEVNCRLQVEHPVTEMIWQINLPAAMLFIAAGGSLRYFKDLSPFFLPQSDKIGAPLPSEGGRGYPTQLFPLAKRHVVGVRLVAEDPASNWRPSTGRVSQCGFRPPPGNLFAYFTVPTAGGTIHPYSDSQFGHLFVSAETRGAAIRTLKEALSARALCIRGEIQTNVDFVREKILVHPSFLNTQITTGWLDSGGGGGGKGGHSSPALALVACVFEARSRFLEGEEELVASVRNGQKKPTLRNEEDVRLVEGQEGREVAVRVFRIEKERFLVSWGECGKRGGDRLLLRPVIEVKWAEVNAAQGTHVVWWGRAEEGNPRSDAYRESRVCRLLRTKDREIKIDFSGSHGGSASSSSFAPKQDLAAVKAPLGGRLVRWLVEEGSEVEKGEPFCEVETMKMLTVLVSPSSGKIKRRNSQGQGLPPGSTFQVGDQLASIKAEKGEGQDLQTRAETTSPLSFPDEWTTSFSRDGHFEDILRFLESGVLGYSVPCPPCSLLEWISDHEGEDNQKPEEEVSDLVSRFLKKTVEVEKRAFSLNLDSASNNQICDAFRIFQSCDKRDEILEVFLRKHIANWREEERKYKPEDLELSLERFLEFSEKYGKSSVSARELALLLALESDPQLPTFSSDGSDFFSEFLGFPPASLQEELLFSRVPSSSSLMQNMFFLMEGMEGGRFEMSGEAGVVQMWGVEEEGWDRLVFEMLEGMEAKNVDFLVFIASKSQASFFKEARFLEVLAAKKAVFFVVCFVKDFGEKGRNLLSIEGTSYFRCSSGEEGVGVTSSVHLDFLENAPLSSLASLELHRFLKEEEEEVASDWGSLDMLPIPQAAPRCCLLPLVAHKKKKEEAYVFASLFIFGTSRVSERCELGLMVACSAFENALQDEKWKKSLKSLKHISVFCSDLPQPLQEVSELFLDISDRVTPLLVKAGVELIEFSVGIMGGDQEGKEGRTPVRSELRLEEMMTPLRPLSSSSSSSGRQKSKADKSREKKLLQSFSCFSPSGSSTLPRESFRSSPDFLEEGGKRFRIAIDQIGGHVNRGRCLLESALLGKSRVGGAVSVEEEAEMREFKQLFWKHQAGDIASKKRKIASKAGTFWVGDFPSLLESAVREVWLEACNDDPHLLVTTAPPSLSSLKALQLDEEGNIEVTGSPSPPPFQDPCGMVAWLAELRTPELEEDVGPREVIFIANDITVQMGSFAIREDKLFLEASKLARKRGIPRIFIAANSGARIGVSKEVFEKVKAKWKDDDPAKGLEFLYLEEKDFAQMEGIVEVEKASLGGFKVFKLTSIFGSSEGGIGIENLMGSASIASETALAYRDALTLTFVSGNSVGIGAYLARLGQRVIQKRSVSILLTGFQALNRLVGGKVYHSNLEVGGPEIMEKNGISHLIVDSDLEGLTAVVKWICFWPRVKGEPAPMRRVPFVGREEEEALKVDEKKALVALLDRKQELSPRLLIQGGILASEGGSVYFPGLTDCNSFVETQKHWAKSVVIGRGRLKGLPVGLIAAQTEVSWSETPADPADSFSRGERRKQPGGVWFPDSAYKTAQAIRDFTKEELPIVILANWRGFSGGRFDMHREVLKFGSMIVEALGECHLPVIVYLPPGADLRGGAWVVLDKMISPEKQAVEVYAAPSARAGILEPSAVVGLKIKTDDLKKKIREEDPDCIFMIEEIERMKSEGRSPTRVLEEKLEERVETLKGPYQALAESFAALHDTPERMLRMKAIDGIVPWEEARDFLFERIVIKSAEMRDNPSTGSMRNPTPPCTPLQESPRCSSPNPIATPDMYVLKEEEQGDCTSDVLRISRIMFGFEEPEQGGSV